MKPRPKRDVKKRKSEGLTKLRAYRKQDPGFQKAITAFVDAEASLEDPLEGEPVYPSETADAITDRFKARPETS